MKKLLPSAAASAVILVILTVAGAAWSQAVVPTKSRAFRITVGTQRTSRMTALHLNIEDAKPKSGVCPYFVRSFEYLPAVSLINIQVYQEVCANEAYGISQGEALWVAPQGLQTKGAKVSVLVNQTPAGSLYYDDSLQTFNVNGDDQ